MNKIKGNNNFRDRQKPEKYSKFKEDNDISKHLTKITPKKMYEYYKCDYCGAEIRITKKWEEKTGGFITLPSSLTKSFPINLALCNKCIKPVIKEFED